MTSLDLIRRLHEHRLWVNAKLLAAASEFGDDELRRSFPIGQGSLWRTLTHLYAAEYVWLAALQGDAAPVTPGDRSDGLPGNQQAAGAASDLAELRRRWQDLGARWDEFLAKLTETSLTAPVRKLSTSSHAGAARVTSTADVLLHVCTHAQYTTAQAVNLLRSLGASDLPDVMLITLARDQAAQAP